ncbi:hypothetical protein [Staphylococcus edaphicus]|uniref:DUF3953 domain-containing protein n=1 Tax=Staphylococcus edaphicus TaxID=1955013 RepID=A0A2C6WQE3_9STAP|nr:hypothetical protein [Staphylococcus edaphicus]PHK49956.1 hypothetical protein BTJ66_05475 [Staphylococcus edaphicus]UQW81783.1 hypothetical protein MNY58_01320 [Staphylococcus edaphicus]
MSAWNNYQKVLFGLSAVFFFGYLLDLINVFTFGETFRLLMLLGFTLLTSIYLFEREKVASLLFMLTSLLILISLIF